MARPKKYSGENFYKELEALRAKYKRCEHNEIEEAFGKYLFFYPMDWGRILDRYKLAVYEELLNEERITKKPAKSVKKKRRRPKKKTT